MLCTVRPANAGIDPSLLQTLPVKGDESGATQRLRQVEALQRPAMASQDIPLVQLDSGVNYREYREGKGEAGTVVCSGFLFFLFFCFLLRADIFYISCIP